MKNEQTPKEPPLPTVRLWDGSQYKTLDQQSALNELTDPKGTLGFKTGDELFFRYPDGAIGRAKNANDFLEAVKAGGQEIDRRSFELRKDARGVLGTLTAFGTGAASGASFGLSDAAAAALDGITDNKLALRERIKAAQEANPLATGIGQVAGTIGSAVALPGGGFVGAASRVATGAVERVAGQQLASLAAKGTLGSIASSGAKLAATGAIEGAAQGVGQTISQQSLQSTPQGPVESLIANVGTGVLFGGAIGGALGAGGKALAPVVKNVSKGFVTGAGLFKGATVAERQSFRNIFEEGTDEAFAFRKSEEYKNLLGERIIQALDAKDPTKLTEELAARVNQELKGLDTTALKQDLQKQAQSFVDLNDPKLFKKELEDSVTKIFNQSEAKGKEISIALNKELGIDSVDEVVGQKAFNVVRDHIDAMLESPTLSPQTKAQLEGLRARVTPIDDQLKEQLKLEKELLSRRLQKPSNETQAVSDNLRIETIDRQLNQAAPMEAMVQLRDLKREVFDLQRNFKNSFTPTDKIVAKELDGLQTVLKKSVWDESIFGENAARLQEFDTAMAKMLSAKEQLKKANIFKKEGMTYTLKKDVAGKFLKEPKNASLFEDYLQANKDLQTMALDMDIKAAQDFIPQGLIKESTQLLNKQSSAFKQLKRRGLVSSDGDGYVLNNRAVDNLLSDPNIDSIVTDLRGEGFRGTTAVISRQEKLDLLKNAGILKKQGQSYTLSEKSMKGAATNEQMGSILTNTFDDPKIRELLEQASTRFDDLKSFKEQGLLQAKDQGFKLQKSGVDQLIKNEDTAGRFTQFLNDPELTPKLDAARNLRALSNQESYTGKSLLMGGIATALMGPKAGAIVAALDNPGMVTKFLTKVYDGSLKIGKGLDSDWYKAAVRGITAGALDSVIKSSASDIQKQSADNSTLKTSRVIASSAQSLMYGNPKQSVVVDAKPMSVAEFKKTVDALNTPQPLDAFNSDPQLKASLMVSQSLTQNFLQSKIPPQAKDDLGQDIPPTPKQLASFKRYIEAANDPMKVFKDMGKGYISQEGLETLKTVYPALYAAMQEEIKGTLLKDPKPRNKLLVAQVLGSSPTLAANARAAAQTWQGLTDDKGNLTQGAINQQMINEGLNPIKIKTTQGGSEPSRAGSMIA